MLSEQGQDSLTVGCTHLEKIICAHVFIPTEPGWDEGEVCRSGKQWGGKVRGSRSW